MTVKRVELLAIEGKRYARNLRQLGQVRIDHNSTVTVVSDAEPGAATIEFRYTASYGAAGLITIEGALVWEGTPQFDAKQLTETWRASSQMPPDVASEIHNTVMRVCLPEAVVVAKDLQLPPPIPLPQIKFQAPGPTGPSAPAGNSMEVV